MGGDGPADDSSWTNFSETGLEPGDLARAEPVADDSLGGSCVQAPVGALPGGDVEEGGGHATVEAAVRLTTGSSSTFLGVSGTIPLQYNFLPKISFSCMPAIND